MTFTSGWRRAHAVPPDRPYEALYSLMQGRQFKNDAHREQCGVDKKQNNCAHGENIYSYKATTVLLKCPQK